MAPGSNSCHGRRSRPGERVEHEVSSVGMELYQPSRELDREGAGWPTRVALSAGTSHTSSVFSMKSSRVIDESDGKPRRDLTLAGRPVESALAGDDYPLGQIP